MAKIGLRKYIETNKTIITIFGILLAILPLSLGYIKDIDKTLAGYLAVTVCIAIILLIIELIPKEEKDYSVSTNAFFGALIAIAVIVIIFITRIYNEVSQSILGFAFLVIAGGLGVISAAKLIELEKKLEKNTLLNIAYLEIAILVYINFEPLIKLSTNPLLALFISGFFFIIIIWGFLEVAYNRLLVGLIYQKVFLKWFRQFSKLLKRIF